MVFLLLTLILFIIFYIIQIRYLVKSFKSNNNLDWIGTYFWIISSIIGIIAINFYTLLIFSYIGNYVIIYFLISFWIVIIYLATLFIGLLLKLLKYIKHTGNKEKGNFKDIKKAIAKPFLTVLIISISICLLHGCTLIIKKQVKIYNYNKIRSEEINKMATFINEKYNLDIGIDDCLYYRAEDYNSYIDFFNTAFTYNVPYLALFKVGDEEITVADRKGFISDNRQVKDLNTIFTEYFYKKTGIQFECIEFGKSNLVGYWDRGSLINNIIQTKFNKTITDDNIDEFISYILNTADLSIIFYIKDEQVNIDNVLSKLEYLKNYSNIVSATIRGYIGNLIITYSDIDFPKEHMDYDLSSEDESDGYKFGFYYVRSRKNNLTFAISLID